MSIIFMLIFDSLDELSKYTLKCLISLACLSDVDRNEQLNGHKPEEARGKLGA